LTAPFDGVVVDVSEDLSAGGWLAAGERVMHVVAQGGSKAEAYVDESALQALVESRSAVFIPNSTEQARVHCRRVQVDAVQLASIEQPAMTSAFGGGVSVQQTRDGRLVPLQPTFRVRLEDCDQAEAPRFEASGMAVIEGERRSLIGAAFRWAMTLWRREALV
jgi:putative peptide zinc metalloprotease protein